MNVTDLIAELLPIAESLFVLIDKIKTDAPDAWASVGQEYVAAVQAWKDAKTLVPPTDTASVPTFTPEPPTVSPPLDATIPTGATVTTQPIHTLTTAEQTALGLPPAHYTP